jgi:transposase InsO family protein
MLFEEKMSIDERYKYLRKMQKRYRRAGNRRARSRLLDEMAQVTELHRKSLIRLMKGNLQRQARRQQRGRTYGPEVDDALRVIAESFDYICAARLSPNLIWMAEVLGQHGEMETRPELLDQLAQISISTVGRIMQRVGQDKPRLPRKGPEQANHIARDIAARRIAWDETEPGHFETDLVHHCGPTAAGQYVHTLQLVDVATGWSERVATLGRSYVVMADGFRQIVARLPLVIKEIHSDNGSEFLNAHLLRFWPHLVSGVELSRSRAYHKNDNRFVEQKNFTLVRAYLGHDRLDSVAQTIFLNQLYDKMWLYYNLFQPVLRLTEKIWRPTENGTHRIKRRYGPAQTPFDRLCATAAIGDERRLALERLREQTNPRQLRQDVYDMIDVLFTLPAAVPAQTEDVYQTLAYPELAWNLQNEG